MLTDLAEHVNGLCKSAEDEAVGAAEILAIEEKLEDVEAPLNRFVHLLHPFVASIAVGQAERFVGNPKSAPPTPTLPENAAFLQKHQAELSQLRTLERGASTPAASAGTNAPPPPATSRPKQ